MITVYYVTKPGEQNTRLYMPGSAWTYGVLEKLTQMGYTVAGVHELRCWGDPDNRDEAEVARKNALLAATGM